MNSVPYQSFIELIVLAVDSSNKANGKIVRDLILSGDLLYFTKQIAL